MVSWAAVRNTWRKVRRSQVVEDRTTGSGGWAGRGLQALLATMGKSRMPAMETHLCLCYRQQAQHNVLESGF